MLVAEILLAVVVLYALSKKSVVRTGVKVAMFSFFFEAFGPRVKEDRTIHRPRKDPPTGLHTPNSDGNSI
jgi:hypothetical protein